ncbi:NADPH-dependent FMN reductase [Thorsellia anophelis]|uniref:Azobenzene reductase n=1 Tax=Thorsellia anophelis DSM 18579 TaxID=1123402 RepID=A0A1I0ELC0_9GAMM|nr:NAD(P)H-dependent oxidoreductase [Thorsellia anophelis]SET46113.1 azobenzene reductase [Thorsellia anophelis DSM 18579]
MMVKPTLLIINGSYREGALSGILANNLGIHADAQFKIEHISVRTLDLPNFDYAHANHPSAERLKQLIVRADGILLISPEYHGCISGSLKNALDYLRFELTDKPLGVFATAGSAKSGGNAVNTLRNIGRSLQANVLNEQIYLSKSELEEGKYLTGNLLERYHAQLRQMLTVIHKNRLYAECYKSVNIAVVS